MLHTTTLRDQQASAWNVPQAARSAYYMSFLFGHFAMMENEHISPTAAFTNHQVSQIIPVSNARHDTSTKPGVIPRYQRKPSDSSPTQSLVATQSIFNPAQASSQLTEQKSQSARVKKSFSVPSYNMQFQRDLYDNVGHLADLNECSASLIWQQPYAAQSNYNLLVNGFVDPHQLQSCQWEMQRSASSTPSCSSFGMQRSTTSQDLPFISSDTTYPASSASSATYPTSHDDASSSYDNVVEDNDDLDLDEIRSGDRPYNELLYDCLLSASNQEMQLKDIYQWFRENTDKGQATNEKAWQNSIRHNLSMNSAFIKGSRSEPNGLKKTMWCLSDDAIRHGRILPTTRYRRNADRSAYRNRTEGAPAVERQRSGALGGQAARRSARLRLRQAVANRNARGYSAPASSGTNMPTASTTPSLTPDRDPSVVSPFALTHSSPGHFYSDISASYPPPTNVMPVGPYYSNNSTPLLTSTSLQDKHMAIDPILLTATGPSNVQQSSSNSLIVSGSGDADVSQGQLSSQPQRVAPMIFPRPFQHAGYLQQEAQQQADFRGRECFSPNLGQHISSQLPNHAGSMTYLGKESVQNDQAAYQNIFGGVGHQTSSYGSDSFKHDQQQQHSFAPGFTHLTFTESEMQGLEDMFASNKSKTDVDNEWDDFCFGGMDQL